MTCTCLGRVVRRTARWLHVDGGARRDRAALVAASTSRARHRACALARWDPPKMMLLPRSAGMCSVGATRRISRARSRSARRTSSTSSRRTGAAGTWPRSFQCSRRGRAEAVGRAAALRRRRDRAPVRPLCDTRPRCTRNRASRRLPRAARAGEHISLLPLDAARARGRRRRARRAEPRAPRALQPRRRGGGSRRRCSTPARAGVTIMNPRHDAGHGAPCSRPRGGGRAAARGTRRRRARAVLTLPPPPRSLHAHRRARRSPRRDPLTAAAATAAAQDSTARIASATAASCDYASCVLRIEETWLSQTLVTGEGASSRGSAGAARRRPHRRGVRLRGRACARLPARARTPARC